MLIDSESTHDLVSDSFVRNHNIPTETLADTLKVTLAIADGSSTSSSLQRIGQVRVFVKDFSDLQSFTVFPLSRYDVILGEPWLTRHNPEINFQTNDVYLNEETLDAKVLTSHPNHHPDHPDPPPSPLQPFHSSWAP
eukprot:scpid95754/ scgid18948/ 